VHIAGETGTGKELAARALHDGGPRAKAAFIAQNCGGMAESLLQSTLFGHKKGAFTGADRDHLGVFREADGGTLFLDEVAELPATVQVSLLRVLQNHEITPLGSGRSEKVSVRVVSATHKDLRQEVAAGRFREDLYFRLVVVTVLLPPLRERVGDIPLLARHLLDAQCRRYDIDVPGFESAAMAALENYPWPGNVRELENEIERLVVLAQPGQSIARASLSPHILTFAGDAPQTSRDREQPDPYAAISEGGLSLDQVVERFERQLLVRALRQHDSNQSLTAKTLKVPRQTLISRLKKLGLV
jgi:DNA-binding NtrC family response regulator